MILIMIMIIIYIINYCIIDYFTKEEKEKKESIF